MLEEGLAAQDYTRRDNMRSRLRKMEVLRKLERGDMVVAAFGKCRFLGCGVLRSELFAGKGGGLQKKSECEFPQRFRCDWVAIPFESKPAFIRCEDLKRRGLQVTLQRRMYVREINQRTFESLKARLDRAGAVPYAVMNDVEETLRSYESEEESFEGGKEKRLTNYYERKPSLRARGIYYHGLNDVRIIE